MARVLPALVAVFALAGCSTVPAPAAAAWPDCAKTQALALIAQGIPSSWSRVADLPAGEPMQSIDLGPDPPDAIHDAFMRTLHLAPSHNAFYVHQTGGIAGVNIIYGPVSLRGRCRALTPSAP